MTANNPAPVRRTLQALVLCCLSLLALVSGPAQADRNFAQRYSINTNGDLQVIGNSMLTCPSSDSNCSSAQAGGNYSDNDFNMVYVDIDSDSNTFDSTSSNLIMPSGSTVLFAGLYWSAIQPSSPCASCSQVLFKTPTSFGYSVINASLVDTNTSSGNAYQGFADVTSIVRAAGSGTYTVANVQAQTGSNYWGGWSLVVVYGNNSLALRNLTVFDGYLYVSAATVTLPVSGFLTPLSGPVNTKLGIVTYDGDLGTTGDTFALNGTLLSDAANPSNNFYNSTISNAGINVTSRSPSYVNNLGFDIDQVTVPAGILGNGATSATIASTSPSTGEVFWLGPVTFATDLYVPIVTPNIVKTATDLNGGSLVAGDILRWTISMSNTGLDTATNLTLTDNIPANVTYVPGTLKITAGANSGAKTDASSDDQAEYISSGTPRVVFRLGTGATSSAGGNLAYNEATTVTFDTTVNSGLPAGTAINNTANISYRGQTIGDTFAGAGAAATSVVMGPPTISKSFSPNPIAVGAASVMSIVIGNPSANPSTLTGVTFSDTYPSGLVNAATPNPQIACTPGATVGTISGGTAGGNTIGLSAGASIPTGGSCTITVNVTSATNGNYTNTTGAVTSSNGGTGSTASATLAVGKPSISKAFSPTSITSGGTTTLTFTLGNTGSVALTGVAFSDTMTSMTVAATPAVSNTCGGTVTAVAGSSTISLSGGNLAATGSCTLSVNVTSSTTGVLTNTATGVSSNESGAAGNPSNTATLTVIGSPQLSKSFSPTSVRTSSPSQLTVTVTNPNSTITLGSVAFTDNYPTSPAAMVNSNPANATINCTSGSTATLVGGANGGTTLGISGGSLAPGGSCTVTANVQAATAGNYVNSTGTATSSNGGTGAAASATLNVTSMTAPTLAKSFSVTTITVGGTTTMTIQLNNSNATAVTGVAFTDSYPTGLTNYSTPALTNTCGGTATGVAGDTAVSLSGGTIPANSNCKITIVVTAAATGVYSNTVNTVTTGNAGTFGPATATLNVLAPPQITKSFSPDAVGVSTASTLTIALSNPSTTSVSLTGVGVVDNFPTNLKISSSTTTNSCGGTFKDQSGTTIGSGDTGIQLSGVTMAPNSSCSITVQVSSTTAGVYVNTTNAVTTTNAGTGSTASATLSVGRPDINKVFSPTIVASGGTSVLTITLSNPTGTAMTTAAFTDTYPSGMTNTSSASGATTCGGTVTAANNGGSVALSGGTIPANSTCKVTVNVTSTSTQINTIAAGGLTVSGGGSNANAATATLQVYAQPTVTKAFSPTTVTPGTSSTMTITLTNANSIASTGTAFTDSYPSGLVNAATPSLSNGCGGTATAAANGTSLTLSGAAIPANSSCSITVNVTSSTAGAYVNNTGTVTTTNIGNGSSASATLTVMGPPVVAKTFNPTSVVVNTVSTLSITLTNNNATAITGVAVTDTYPSGLVNDSTPNATTSCTGGTLSATAGGNSVALSGATIPASGSCTISIRVLSASPGSYTNNTGSVTTSNAGTGTSASAVLTVTALQPALNVLKLVSVFSDPVNNATNPKAIPGSISTYTIRITNTGPGTVDSNSLVLTDPIPTQTTLYVGDIGTAGSGPIVFADGSPASGLSYTYSSLASTTDNLDFSKDNGATWTYTPVPDASGFDALVTNVRVRPQGTMVGAGGSNPYFEISFRVKVK